MTPEKKQLLLQDLSARLMYGVNVQMFAKEFDNKVHEYNVELNTEILQIMMDEKDIVYLPYLRPMSSMTEEEARTIFEISGCKSKDILQIKITDEYLEAEIDDGCYSFERHVIWYNEIVNSIQIFDFLVSNHFDYRGLIPMGLALPAPEGMYNIKK